MSSIFLGRKNTSMKKFSLLAFVLVLVSAGMSYAADHWATTNMTWAEFYAGETGETALHRRPSECSVSR